MSDKPLKAYFVSITDSECGEIVLAETRGKAKMVADCRMDVDRFTDLRALRVPSADGAESSGYFWLEGQAANRFYTAYTEAIEVQNQLVIKANQIGDKLLDLIQAKLRMG